MLFKIALLCTSAGFIGTAFSLVKVRDELNKAKENLGLMTLEAESWQTQFKDQLNVSKLRAARLDELAEELDACKRETSQFSKSQVEQDVEVTSEKQTSGLASNKKLTRREKKALRRERNKGRSQESSVVGVDLANPATVSYSAASFSSSDSSSSDSSSSSSSDSGSCSSY